MLRRLKNNIISLLISVPLAFAIVLGAWFVFNIGIPYLLAFFMGFRL